MEAEIISKNVRSNGSSTVAKVANLVEDGSCSDSSKVPEWHSLYAKRIERGRFPPTMRWGSGK